MTYYGLGAQALAMRVVSSTGNVLYHLHSDHLGSVSLVTDHASRIIAQQRFLPYGGVRWSEGAFPTDVGFTGHRGQAGLGLIFMRARYYSPALGRFVSADTIVPEPGNPQSLNRFAYVLGNPLRYVDPRGYYYWEFESLEAEDFLCTRMEQSGGVYRLAIGLTQLVQTFWSKQRLQAVEVQSAGQSQVVRRYELSAGYDEEGRLRLLGVQEVTADGTRLPAMTFGYLQLAGYSGNCVQGQSEGGYKPWLVWVSTGYGGSIGFGYTEWPGFQNGQILGPNEGGKCWYRYRVRRVTVNPGIGPEMHTLYEYRTLQEQHTQVRGRMERVSFAAIRRCAFCTWTE